MFRSQEFFSIETTPEAVESIASQLDVFMRPDNPSEIIADNCAGDDRVTGLIASQTGVAVKDVPHAYIAIYC